MVSANDAREAYERINESLSTMLVEFSIPSIIFSPIVDIFPPSENLDREISRRPMEDFAVEENPQPKGVVFQASGSDIDDEDFDDLEDFEVDEEEEDELEGEVSDEYAE